MFDVPYHKKLAEFVKNLIGEDDEFEYQEDENDFSIEVNFGNKLLISNQPCDFEKNDVEHGSRVLVYKDCVRYLSDNEPDRVFLPTPKTLNEYNFLLIQVEKVFSMSSQQYAISRIISSYMLAVEDQKLIQI